MTTERTTTIKAQQLRARENLQTPNNDSDTDSIATASTVVSSYESDKEYEVEQILAEKQILGRYYYLIKWANYPIMRATWEPEENILDPNVVSAWKPRLEQQRAGKSKAFDVAAWELKMEELKSDKERRKVRREEKRQRKSHNSLGRPISSNNLASDDSDNQPLSTRRSQKVAKLVQQSDDDDKPLSMRRRASTNLKKANKKPMKTKESEESDSVETDDSLMEELQSKAMGKETRANQSKSKATEKTKEPLREKRRSSIARRSTDSPAESPLLRTMAPEFPRQPSRRASRDSSQDIALPRSMGNPRGRGGTSRGQRGRSGSGATRGGSSVRIGSVGDKNVFTKSDNPRKKLGDLISPVTVDHSVLKQPRNLSELNSIQTTARNLENRAVNPELAGGLFIPAEAKNSRTAYKKAPQLPDNQNRRTSTTDTAPGSPISRRSSNARVVRFADGNDENSGHIIEEPSPNVDSSGLRGGSNRASPVKQAIAEGIIQQDVPARQITPKLISRVPMAHNDTISHRPPPPPSIIIASNPVPNKPIFQVSAGNESTFRPSIGPKDATTPTTANTRIVTNQAESAHTTSARKIFSMSQYTAMNGIEKGSYLVKIASFGGAHDSQILVAFNKVARNSQELWVKEIGSLDAINFRHVCASTSFKTQPVFGSAKVLACGIIGTNSDDKSVLEHVSEHLRLRLSGLIFSYLSIAILLFPTRTDEWKFLENGEVSKEGALRYHIFELPEFCPTITYPLAGPISSRVGSLPSYWSSALEFLCSLSYESFVPPLEGQAEENKAKNEEKDRDKFFLLIPENATPSLRFLTTWLKFCKPSCKIISSHKPGSWSVFTKDNYFGTILVHESLVHVIPKLAGAGRLAFSKNRAFIFFKINSCPTPRPGLSLHDSAPSTFTKTRLFPPLGGAFFITPNVYRTNPKLVLTFLNWFRFQREMRSPSGRETYKLLGCHGLRELLLDIANEKALERSHLRVLRQGQEIEPEAKKKGLDFDSCRMRYEVVEKIEALVEEADTVLPPYYDLEDVDDSENSIIYASEHIDRNNESELIEWFAGWSLVNLNKHRKFWVIGTDPSNFSKAVRTTHNPEAQRFKKTFTLVTEVTPAPLFSTVAPTMQSDVTDGSIGPLASSPVVRQARAETGSFDLDIDVWGLESKIAAFIATTGTSDAQAIDCLTKANADLDAAVRMYYESLTTSVDGLGNTLEPKNSNTITKSLPGILIGEAEGTTLPAINMRSDTIVQPNDLTPESRQGQTPLSMVPRNIKQISRQRSTSDILANPTRIDESGDVIMKDGSPASLGLHTQLGSDSSGLCVPESEKLRSPNQSPIKLRKSFAIPTESTVEWYANKKNTGQGWAHINVIGLQDAIYELDIEKKKRG